MSKLSRKLVIALAITGGVAIVLIGLSVYLWSVNGLKIVSESDYQKIEKFEQNEQQKLDEYQQLQDKAVEQYLKAN